VRLDPDCRLDASLHLTKDWRHMSVNLQCTGKQSINPQDSLFSAMQTHKNIDEESFLRRLDPSFDKFPTCISLHHWRLLPCKNGWRYGCGLGKCFRQCNAALLVGSCLTVEWCFLDSACKTHADCTRQQAYLKKCKGTCTFGWQP